jgi:anti-sigma regulatory factor (Ser/Thr protein kinase)
MSAQANVNRCELEHFALFYGDPDEFVVGTSEFLQAGLASNERVLVAVPSAKIDAMRSGLNGDSEQVEFWDMNQLGRNPGRIIPAVRDWVDRGGGRRCRFIGEPIWPGRNADEVVEATRHEALINLAFSDVAVTILCPYDTAGLDEGVLADAERTHPQLIRRGEGCSNGRYTDPLELWQARDWPLTGAALTAARHAVSVTLADTREFAASKLREAGLSEDRLQDVVLAVDEATTNALVHGRGAVELLIWREGDQMICEIADQGRMEEPLAGRRRPRPDWMSGRGVWLMNQLCDLVELRPTDTGTVVRLHVALGKSSSVTGG